MNIWQLPPHLRQTLVERLARALEQAAPEYHGDKDANAVAADLLKSNSDVLALLLGSYITELERNVNFLEKEGPLP